MRIISLFRYSTIEPFLLTKHTPAGFRIYRYFAKRHIRPFLELFSTGLQERAYLIGIDEDIESGYSHTAILSHYGRQKNLIPLHGRLFAKNRVSYAGKSLSFRLNNPRNFTYTGPSNIDVVLIDDIVTTGLTLQEAQNTLLKYGVSVLFALTLADARE
jgi:competence protein ComFC